jgi:hypothetical protein
MARAARSICKKTSIKEKDINSKDPQTALDAGRNRDYFRTK